MFVEEKTWLPTVLVQTVLEYLHVCTRCGNAETEDHFQHWKDNPLAGGSNLRYKQLMAFRYSMRKQKDFALPCVHVCVEDAVYQFKAKLLAEDIAKNRKRYHV